MLGATNACPKDKSKENDDEKSQAPKGYFNNFIITAQYSGQTIYKLISLNAQEETNEKA